MSQLRVHLGIFAFILAAVAGLLIYQTARASGATDVTRDVVVNCGPAAQAVIRQGASQSRVAVDCVSTGPVAAMQTGLQTWLGSYGDVAAPESGPVMVPAVYTTRPAPVAQVVRTPAARQQTVSQTGTPAVRTAERRAQPTWKKRALVIGGTAGAGAGIGALIGGKKGALIGAAIGGGGAAIVDHVRH